MKRFYSAVLAFALAGFSTVLTAQSSVPHEECVVSASCCCCLAEKSHHESPSCKCDGCAQKNSANCGCVAGMTAPFALMAGTGFDVPTTVAGWLVPVDLVYKGRTDSPLLRPPIFS